MTAPHAQSKVESFSSSANPFPSSGQAGEEVRRPFSAAGALQVQVLPLSQLTSSDRQAWAELEADSDCDNPFLSPHFVFPAWKHLEAHTNPLLIVVSQGNQWLGLGIFESSRPRRRFPVPHLRSWRSEHTYLQGVLLRRGEEELTLRYFWEYLLHGNHNWHAVAFSQLPHDAEYYETLHQTAHACGAEFIRGPSYFRACLRPQEHTQESLMAGISSRRQRSLRQAWNWLNRQGEVNFQFQRDARQLSHSCHRFLELEALGWKGSGFSALACTPANLCFFQEMSSSFLLRKRLFISELSCDSKVVGSVVHLTAGKAAYAFKLGWETELARACPGFQLKAQMLYQVRAQFPQLSMVDSCSSPGSFIEHVWPDRREISNTIFFTSRAGNLAGNLIETFRRVRNYGKRLLANQFSQENSDKSNELSADAEDEI